MTTNAKTFNPPGSIYYSEADRLEAWGLDHITRASAHVIEYETDWNIDVEQDDDGSTSQLPVNIDDEVSTPRDIDGSLAAGSRAPSTTPAPGQAPLHGAGKRGPRGPYKKHAQPALPESLDADGRMPGARDGVGAFPAGSDWAELMIALKIKGASPLPSCKFSIKLYVQVNGIGRRKSVSDSRRKDRHIAQTEVSTMQIVSSSVYSGNAAVWIQ